VLSYQYDAKHRLEAVTGSTTRSYIYDALGDVTGDGSLSFEHNDAQQLECVSCGTTEEVRYEYDGLGERVATRTARASPLLSFHSANGQLLAEISPGGIGADEGRRRFP
jgi:hypothetical protein